MGHVSVTRVAALAVVICASTGCSSQSALPYMNDGIAMHALDGTGAGKIKHVVYIIQENRSFDNMFYGYPGADTAKSGKNSHGKTIELKPYPLGHAYVIDHSAQAMFAACNGTGKLPGTDCRMNGFNNEMSCCGPANPEYVYVPHDQSKPYFDMAHEGALADRMFQSQLDESWAAHQYIVAAQDDDTDDLPSGRWGCGGGKYDVVATIVKERDPNGPPVKPCFQYETLADELDQAHLTWRFYAATYGSDSSDGGAEWSGYMAVKRIWYGPDRKNIISPNWMFITDVRAGHLANFTWITPVCDDSDHVNCNGFYGPSWVSALVNAVGTSRFWDSTAIFIQWDDWGGLYDHVPPPYEGLDSLGFRVPLIMLSPYAKRDHVCHLQYETASVLRFAEDLYGLDQLAAADRRARSPANECFDFSQSPLPFVKIPAPYPPKFFMHNRYGDNYFAPDYE